MKSPPEPLLRHWHDGWSRSRGLPSSEDLDGVLCTVVGRPGRDVERLVLDADARPRRIDRAAIDSWADRDPWVTVPTCDPGRTADRLAEHGLLSAGVPEWLMTITVADQRVVGLPGGYRCVVTTESADVVVLELRDPDDRLGASGRVAVTPSGVGAFAVPDMITTERAHRRQGLGAATMGLLLTAARERGADQGVLIASDEGRRLYLGLGWRLVSAVVVGRRP